MMLTNKCEQPIEEGPWYNILIKTFILFIILILVLETLLDLAITQKQKSVKNSTMVDVKAI